jgi:hypothetical protein
LRLLCQEYVSIWEMHQINIWLLFFGYVLPPCVCVV